MQYNAMQNICKFINGIFLKICTSWLNKKIRLMLYTYVVPIPIQLMEICEQFLNRSALALICSTACIFVNTQYLQFKINLDK